MPAEATIEVPKTSQRDTLWTDEQLAALVKEKGYRDGFYRLVVNDPKDQFPVGVSLPLVSYLDDKGLPRNDAFTVEKTRRVFLLTCPASIGNERVCGHEWFPETPFRPGIVMNIDPEEAQWANRVFESHHCPACKEAGRRASRGVRKLLNAESKEVMPAKDVEVVWWLKAAERAAFDLYVDPERKGVKQYDTWKYPDGTTAQRLAGVFGGPLEKNVLNGVRVADRVKLGPMLSLIYLGEKYPVTGDLQPATPSIDKGQLDALMKRLRGIDAEAERITTKLGVGTSGDERKKLDGQLQELNDKRRAVMDDIQKAIR